MDFYRTGVGFGERSAQASKRNGTSPSKAGQKRSARNGEAVRKNGERLRGLAGVLLTLAATMPASYGQQAGAGTSAPVHNVVQVPDKAASDLPVAPAPVSTEPSHSGVGYAIQLGCTCRRIFRRRASTIPCVLPIW
jgi:hypothetical protein